MKNFNNNPEKKAIENLKSIIKADFFESIELVKYGIQIYNAFEGEEYCVIIRAEKYNGRYYFIDRERRRVAWSSLPADRLAIACRDFIDRMNADETAEISENTTTRHNVTAARVNHIATTIANAVGVAFGSNFPSYDMKCDLQRFYKWQNPATLATDEINPADLFFFAIRKQGSESGTRRHVRERCKVLGRPVYVLRVAQEYTADGDKIDGRFCLTVRACNDNDTKTVVNSNTATPADTTTESNTRKADHFQLITNPAAAGLALNEIPGGVAITGNAHDIFRAQNSLKAHGAEWNHDTQQWQATDPADVADLRAWFEPLPAPVSSKSNK